MHKIRSANDLPTESGANGLMSQADTQQRHFSGEVSNNIDADAGFLRRAWSGGYDNTVRMLVFNFVDSDLVVARDYDLRT